MLCNIMENILRMKFNLIRGYYKTRVEKVNYKLFHNYIIYQKSI